MARRHERDFDRVFNFARTSLFIQPLSDPLAAALDDEGLAVDPDEPPDNRLTASPHSYQSMLFDPQIMQTPPAGTYTKKSATPMTMQPSLLTEGLLTAANLKDVPLSQGAFMERAGSQASAYSLTSNHGLTSDGGMSSPTHTGTPSPPLPPAMQTGLAEVPASKTRTIKFAGEKTSDVPFQKNDDQTKSNIAPKARKTCISFACAPPKPPVDAPTTVGPAKKSATAPTQQPKRTCTIKFACEPKPTVVAVVAPKQAPLPAPKPDSDIQTMPKPAGILTSSGRQPRGSQSTIISTEAGRASINKVTSGDAVSPTEIRKLEKRKRLQQLTSTRPEDEAWMTDEPKHRKPITVSDTLRKENAIRKLAEEASQEIDEEYDLDDIVDDEEEDENFPATGSRYMAYDEDESDGGHETDDEEGFAASDDESDDDPDFQFWTTTQTAIAPVLEQPELMRPHHHHRTASESSLDSHLRPDSGAAAKQFLSANGNRRRRSPREQKMRPGTPELPDSTDFVCGTLDEDRPLEEAYLSCIKQRKLEKRGIIPQDLDPSFPTSDPENIDEEDEVTEGLASTASDHHFLGGRFDESDVSQDRGRRSQSKAPTIHRPSPRRLQSPPPQKPHVKSPVPMSGKLRAKSPAPPRKLFARSPVAARSPAPAHSIHSPPTSPKRISFRTPHLAQRNTPQRTASLPHTPNPFFVAHERKMRARAKKQLVDLASHSRGPIDIKQGLEARKQRRKEHYWRKHCRDHKDKSRRCAPGKGAERMRELGLEMAHRNKAYGQKLELMLSV